MYHSKYLNGLGILRDYQGNGFKVSCLSSYRIPGYEDRKHTAKGEAGIDSKLDNNLSRTRNRIKELAMCNEWQWFVTLTLDAKKYDRTNLPQFIKDLAQLIRNYRRKSGLSVKYLLIPEHHKDGCWHLHGLFMGLPADKLHAFQRSEHLPIRILQRLDQGIPVYTWEEYSNRFGYAVFEPIRNHEAVCNYITKYITKDMLNTIKELNAHSFYASHGLKQSTVLLQDLLPRGIESPDYENDYCSVKWFDKVNDALACFSEE